MERGLGMKVRAGDDIGKTYGFCAVVKSRVCIV